MPPEDIFIPLQVLYNGWFKFFKQLCEDKIDVDISDLTWTPLTYCIKHKLFDQIKHIMIVPQMDLEYTNNGNNDGWGPMLYACSMETNDDAYEAMEILMKKGANADQRDDDNKTCGMFAAERGYFNIVRYLVDRFATVDVQNK